MRIIDLRNRQDAHIQNAQSIRRIIEGIGRAETSRQNRQRTTNVLQAMAAGGTPQDIARAATVDPQFDTGFQGFIQQLGARFAPNVVSPIEQQIARQGLSRAFEDPLIREQRQASIESTKALTEQRKRRKTTTTAVSALQKQWEFKRKQRDLLTDRLDRAAAFQNEAEKESVNLKIQKLDSEMDAISKQLSPRERVTAEIDESFFTVPQFQPGEFAAPGSMQAPTPTSTISPPPPLPQAHLRRVIKEPDTIKKRRPNETIEQFLKRTL